MVHQPHVAIVVLLVAAVLVTAAVGAVVGIAAARLRGPYLAGATLALAVALPELATRYRSTLGGEQGLPLRTLGSPGWLSPSFPAERWLAWVGVVSGLVVLVLLANLMVSGRGRRWRTVRDDETAASLVGINVPRTQVNAFVVSAACAGLGGSLYGLANSLANPAGFTVALSFALLTAIVVGGLGSLAGSIWGAIALVYIPHLTNNVSEHFKFGTAVKGNLPLAIYGLVLVIAMLVFPEGIQGGLRRLSRIVPGLRSRPVEGG
jgi:branched-chain amino acid transport system permease protein